MDEPKRDSNMFDLAGQLWDIVRDFHISMFKYVWWEFEKVGNYLIRDVGIKTLNWLNTVDDKAWSNLFNGYRKAGMLTDGQVTKLMQMSHLAFPLNFIILGISSAMMFMMFLGSYMKLSTMFNEQANFKKYRPNIPSYGEMISAALVAPEKTDRIREVMRKHGLTEEDIDILFITLYKVYDENMIRTLWLRNVLTDDEMKMRMNELGYTNTRIAEIVKTWELLPSPQDLLHMVAKEAFEPDMVALMGLEDEFPEDQVTFLKQQGVSKFWSMKYWSAHWEIPSIGQGFEMLHRDAIKDSELKMLFKAAEIPPYWRDKLKAIAYSPFTRVDVRRMHKMNIINDEQLVRSYMDLGYDADKALDMAKFTIQYNMGADRDLSKSDILGAYQDGLMNRNDAKLLLEDLNFSSTQAEFYISRIEFEDAREQVNDQINVIGDKYIKGLINYETTITKLNSLNIPAKQRDRLLEKWEIHLFEDVSLPSKTDLDKFFKNKIIDMVIYKEEMQKLGYEVKYVNWFSQLVSGKKEVN